ncbi:MAG: ABC transporter substrate-binding protein [Galactobacter sp.]
MTTPRTPENPTQPATAQRKRLSFKQKLVTGVGAVAVVAVAASVTVAVLSSRSSPEQRKVAATSHEFDLSSATVKDRIRLDQVPEAVKQLKESGFTPVPPGTLTVATAASAPPLGQLAEDDNKTVVGEEADLAQLVADGLGLKLKIVNVSWSDWPLGVQSGKYDIVASNVTVTDERKKLFDFASTRQDLLGFLVSADSDIKSITAAEDISGLKLSVSSGTNQEKVLLEWNKTLKDQGKKPADLVYYDDMAASTLAIASGRIDGFLGPTPTSQFQVKTGDGKFKVVGTVEGGWPDTAPIAIGTDKGNGLIEPIHTVIQSALDDGSYAKVLERWGLQDEAVETSEINPQGIPENVGK